MKHIVKQSEPSEFIEWKGMESEDWKPTYDALRGSKTGKIVKDSIIREQGGLCCYCERRIDESNSHIEHFRPQSVFTNESLEYGNMLCSCFREVKKGTELHCGHLKGEWFDENLLISPLDSICESRFAFELDGRMMQSKTDDTAAQTTIERLGLNAGKLIAKRKALLDVFNGAGHDGLTESDIETFTWEDQRAFAEGYLRRGNNGMFEEFWSTIQYMLGQM